MPRGRRFRLRHEAGRTRTALLGDARLGVADLQGQPGNDGADGYWFLLSNGAADWPSDLVEDDRNTIKTGDPVLLIVEDDVTFARILLDMAHERGLKALIATTGNAALTLAREFRPSAITLDITLPDTAGWLILDRLKHDPQTRHIPVHIISGDDNRRKGLALGAMTYVEKAVDQDKLSKTFGIIGDSAQRRRKKVLIVSPNGNQIESAIAADDLTVVRAYKPDEALSILTDQYVDGIIVDLALPGQSPVAMISDVQTRVAPFTPPVIVFGENNDDRLNQISSLLQASAVRYAPDLNRLLDETVVLLHRDQKDLGEGQRRRLEGARSTDNLLDGRTVLVIDDDVRNIFALTSVLTHHNLKVVHANNGRDGIDLLERTPEVDIVLMDIMMPEMDGYETMKAIRTKPEFANLPVIALTAKAMKGDREKCIQAGATDYVAKPVDLDQLFAAMRVCIGRSDTVNSTQTRKE